MGNFKCEHCGAAIFDSPRGYITGCKHYPLEVNVPSNRRTSFLELLMKQQITNNVVTKSVYTSIIKGRIDNSDYS